VLSRVVVEREQLLFIARNLRDGRGELRAVGSGERLDGLTRLVLGLGVPDFCQGLLRTRVRGLRQRAENVCDFMESAALFPRLGKHIAQRLPEPECSVAGGQHRGAYTAAGAVAQQVSPRLR